MEQIKASQPIALAGAFNVRELGGYPTKNGARTKTHVLLRGDGLSRLTDNDLDILKNYGVRRVIDLRSAMEAEREPDCFSMQQNISYHNIMLLDEIASNDLKGGFPTSLAILYQNLLTASGALLAEVMRLLARAEDGCTLFHCTAGKDRTGIISMLLLRLAEVPDDWIIADYAASEAYLAPLFQKQKQAVRAAGIDFPDYLLRSSRESAEETLLFLDQSYGGAESYLHAIGLKENEIDALKMLLIGQNY